MPTEHTDERSLFAVSKSIAAKSFMPLLAAFLLLQM